MRGISGSGKSTLANKLKVEVKESGNHAIVLSTDDYWMEDGEYKFDITRLSEAHKWNLNRAEASISYVNEYDCVIIDNTNIVWKDFKKYVQLAIENDYDIMLAEPKTIWKNNIIECDKRNTHNVPRETIERMSHKYQSNEEIIGYAREMINRMDTMSCVHIFEYDPIKLFES